MAKQYCVSVKFQDGSSALLGPVGSRPEARKLAERHSGNGKSALISPWSGPPSNGSGVLRPRTPPPFQAPAPAVPQFTVTYDDQTDVVTIDSDIAFFGIEVGAIELYLDSLAGQWLLTEGQFTTVSPTQITFPSASSYGVLLEEVEFWDGPGQTELLATWVGSVSVAAPSVLSITSVESDTTEELRILGENLDLANELRVWYNNGGTFVFFDVLPIQAITFTPTVVEVSSPLLAGETINEVILYDTGDVLDSLDGLSVAVPGPDIEVVYDNGTDELTITTTVYDFTDCSSFNYSGNGSGQLQNPTHFVPTQTEIVVSNAAFLLNGGTLTELTFFGPSPTFDVIATWNGSVDLS